MRRKCTHVRLQPDATLFVCLYVWVCLCGFVCLLGSLIAGVRGCVCGPCDCTSGCVRTCCVVSVCVRMPVCMRA